MISSRREEVGYILLCYIRVLALETYRKQVQIYKEKGNLRDWA